MPFHFRLLGKDRMALYSFIQSLNTSFGISIFEPVAVEIAKTRFKEVGHQRKAETKISSDAQKTIQELLDNLEAATSRPNKEEEVAKIRAVCQSGDMKSVRKTDVDLYLKSYNDDIYYIDIKTAKPNKKEFQAYKRMLLDWVGVVLAENPDAKIHTEICIPYNPYEPKPYQRWTMAGMLDLDVELRVGKEFWDFLGGDGAYEEVLDCFEEVGIEMRDEIDANFKKYLK